MSNKKNTQRGKNTHHSHHSVNWGDRDERIATDESIQSHKAARRSSFGCLSEKTAQKDASDGCRTRRRAKTTHAPQKLQEKRSIVLLRVYDLSDGWAALWSSLVIGRKIEGLWHTGIEVFGYEYFYGGGILKMLPQDVEDAFGMSPSKIHTLGYTTMGQQELETYLNEISDSFSKECYDLTRWNCNNFTDHISKMLISKGIPRYVLELPEEITSTLAGKLIVSCLNAFRGEPPMSLENPKHPCHNLSSGKETYNRRQKRVQSTPPSPTKRRAAERLTKHFKERCTHDAHERVIRRWTVSSPCSTSRDADGMPEKVVRISVPIADAPRAQWKNQFAKPKARLQRQRVLGPAHGMHIPLKRCDSDPSDVRQTGFDGDLQSQNFGSAFASSSPPRFDTFTPFSSSQCYETQKIASAKRCGRLNAKSNEMPQRSVRLVSKVRSRRRRCTMSTTTPRHDFQRSCGVQNNYHSSSKPCREYSCPDTSRKEAFIV